ncbi:MAG: flagellar hook-length control protein FliK [Alphaproteobacteria bacterium]|nr:MAG: flagellar hook-length control protein FliK [Alphaproteobacteria bacterium]
MDKISTQKFNVNVKNSDMSKSDDVLGALFSMPMIADEKKVKGKIIDEFIVNPSIEKVLNSKKSSKSLGKLEIMYKEFFSGNSKKQANGLMFKNDQVFDFNSTKIPNVLSLDLKLDKLSKINHANNDGTKDLDLKINASDENEKRLLKASEKINLAISPHNNFVNKNNVKKSISNKNNLNDIFAKLDHLKEDIKSNNFENKIMFYENEITYKQLKVNSETNSFANNIDQMNKVENFNLRNNFSQNQFNGDKNLNFVLDQMIEELDMSKLGWTEKLILRIEKGFKEDENHIEMALKPKELGNLKINLKIKDKSANVIIKVENAASMVALQSNEGLLVKSLSEQGFILEKINFENSLMSSNKENKNSSENNKDNNFNKDEATILDDEEHYKDDNLNYLININA